MSLISQAFAPDSIFGMDNRFHQWQANLRILEVTEIKSIPYVPLSHPFVERLIGTFVEGNKSAVLLRFPLCGVRSDNAAAGIACTGSNAT
jgi:hypothetical protein